MRLRYTRAALSDLGEVEAYLAARHPAATATILQRIRTAVDRLATFPDSGRPGRVAGTRELVVPETPFIIAYRQSGGSIDILAVLHGARRWPSGFGRE